MSFYTRFYSWSPYWEMAENFNKYDLILSLGKHHFSNFLLYSLQGGPCEMTLYNNAN